MNGATPCWPTAASAATTSRPSATPWARRAGPRATPRRRATSPAARACTATAATVRNTTGSVTSGDGPPGAQPAEHVERRGEVGRAEEHPGEADHVEGHEPAHQRRHARASRSGSRSAALDRQGAAVDRRPRPGTSRPRRARGRRAASWPSGCGTCAGARRGCRRAGCRGSRAASATASCASAARTGAGWSPCRGGRSSAGSLKPEQQREADRHVGVAGEVAVDLAREAVDREQHLGAGAAGGSLKTGSTIRRASSSATTVFFTKPPAISSSAGPASTARGSRGVRSWGSSSFARTIGPATRWGKKAWRIATSPSDAAGVSRR